MTILLLSALCAGAYLLGSIPCGLLLTRYAGLGDIREVGSGNIGATNVLRTGGKRLAIVTLFLDMLKGAAAVWIAFAVLPAERNIANHIIPSPEMYAVSLAVILGHIFPIWLKFKGGKGVATAFGVLYALAPITFVITAINWSAMFWIKRVSSLAALMAFMLIPLWMFIFTDIAGALFGALLFGILCFTHRANIRRLQNGTEPRFGSAPAEQ